MAFSIILNVSWCSGEVEGKELGSGFLCSRAKSKHVPHAQAVPATLAAIFGWVFKVMGLI